MKVTLTFFILAFAYSSASTVFQWERIANSEVPSSTVMKFKFALKPQNVDYLDNLFWQISNPESPFFGRFLNHDQIADLISVPEEELSKVENYISSYSGDFCETKVERSLHRDYLSVETCAGQVRRIFPNVHLAYYQKEDEQAKLVRSEKILEVGENLDFLGIPRQLHRYLVAIHDVTDLPVEHIKTELPNPTQPWMGDVKELSITEIVNSFGVNMDNIQEEAMEADVGQVRQGIVELFNTAPSASGLKLFQQRYHIKVNPVKPVGKQQVVPVLSIEANLDAQTITAIAQGVQTWSLAFNGVDSWVDVAEMIMKLEGAPKVLSVCWGDLETKLGASMVTAANIQFMKMGLAGFTWISAAGDSGPTLNPHTCDSFEAQFPAASPYVVSVGGNKINKTDGVQSAWMHSGGGFSTYAKRPPCQEEAVQNYLNNTTLPPNPGGKRYTTSGRAFPDVSGFAAYYPMVIEGKFYPWGSGTSAAAPQFAGIITLIQIQRYQKGLGPLGPLIQTLYKLKNGVGFDVTVGETYATSRQGCKGDILPGFQVSKGWDPATGLGSPKYNILLEQLLDLGNKE
mmetsp:Transcript_58860/g.67062  ORF Transcript_58860/g.67062 Transcript_58860/m.67062 type:complete len:570 (+) Transcript_58860:24-1733(+)